MATCQVKTILVAVGSVTCFALQGCASRSVNMIHPGSGATVRCEAEGTGLMAARVSVLLAECIKGYEDKGYLQAEELTPEQRTDLQRRGLLPPPTSPRSY